MPTFRKAKATDTKEKPKKLSKIDTFLTKGQQYIKVAGKIAQMAVLVRGKPRFMDYMAFGAAALEVVSDIRTEAINKENAFNTAADDWLENQGWVHLHFSLVPTVAKHIGSQRKVETPDDVFQDVMEGYVGKAMVRWYCTKEGDSEKPKNIFYQIEKYNETMDAIADVLWANYGSDCMSYDPAGLKDVEPLSDEIYETSFVQNVTNRVQRFLDSGQARGVLINGVPGTGKSHCVRLVCKKLGFRALYVHLTALDNMFSIAGNNPTVDVIIKMVRPDVLVIDDVDRLDDGDQPELLTLLELAKTRCKVVFVTTNNKDKLLAPLMRPGRLDDLLEVPSLDYNIVRMIADDTDEVIERIKEWPISYICDFANRKKALGRDEAIRELDLLEYRVKSCAENPTEEINVYAADVASRMS